MEEIPKAPRYPKPWWRAGLTRREWMGWTVSLEGDGVISAIGGGKSQDQQNTHYSSLELNLQLVLRLGFSSAEPPHRRRCVRFTSALCAPLQTG